jgi:hypothetical protein
MKRACPGSASTIGRLNLHTCVACAGKKVNDKDVIKLLAGGTGFAGREGQTLESSKSYVLGPGSGKADLRGQAASGASRFGLTFRN